MKSQIVMTRNISVYTDLAGITLEEEDFARVSRIIYDYSGINLHEGKHALVRARLMKRLRKLKLNSFKQYLDYIESEEGSAEFLSFVDVLTTNKTHFFRESRHFDFIYEEVIRELNGRPVKWWSAGCSSGEEPVTLAIILEEALKNNRIKSDVKILATDLSREVLSIAKAGCYPDHRMTDVNNALREKYFNKNSSNESYEVVPSLMKKITYGRLNLLSQWPLKGPFQLIMCRNVMIYFDRKTQQELISRFYQILEPGGYLFIGHSESVSGNKHSFKNVIPAVYRKPGGHSK